MKNPEITELINTVVSVFDDYAARGDTAGMGRLWRVLLSLARAVDSGKGATEYKLAGRVEAALAAEKASNAHIFKARDIGRE